MRKLRNSERGVAVVAVAIAVVSAGAGTAGAAPAAAAALTNVAFWGMNDFPGEKIMNDSSGNRLDAPIGSRITLGAKIGDGVGFGFPAPITGVDAQRLVAVPDSPLLDPGTRDFSVTAYLKTTRPSGNVLQKGQAATQGGFYKLELVDGYALCTYRGASGSAVVGSRVRVDDGLPHTVECQRTATDVAIRVDAGTFRRLPKVSGAISNAAPFVIGGKLNCNGTTTTCDYFTGVLGSVRVDAA